MKKNNWFTILLVALLSAGAALLFAPTSGKQLRGEIKKKAIDTKDNVKTGAENLIEDFKESYAEAVDEVDKELALLEERQIQLRETISSIENELN